MQEQSPSTWTSLEGCIGDGHLDLYSGLDRDGSDLLHDLRGRVQVEDALVDAHLKPIPGVGSLPAWRLAGDDLELFGGKTDRAGHLELLLHGALLQVCAHYKVFKREAKKLSNS